MNDNNSKQVFIKEKPGENLKRKEDARAAIRLSVKNELRGKVPFSELHSLLKEVIEQAEGRYRDWPLEA